MLHNPQHKPVRFPWYIKLVAWILGFIGVSVVYSHSIKKAWTVKKGVKK